MKILRHIDDNTVAHVSSMYGKDGGDIVQNPMISVCIIAYNAVDWIEQAIEGVMNQNGYYNYEVIISDDCSTDGTCEIVRSQLWKHPDKVKTLTSTRNLGPDSGMCNFVRCLQDARGKYVAILEADDFWHDFNKLKDQVSFLEHNADYSCSFTQANVDEHGFNFTGIAERYANAKEHWEPSEVLDNDFQCATAGLVFRRDLVKKLPRWFYDCAYIDRPIRGMLAKHGKFHCLQRKAVTYRLNNWGGLYKLMQTGSANVMIESHKVFKGLASYHKEHRPQLAARRDELASKIYKKQGGKRYLLGHLRHKMRSQPVKIQESITA